MQNNNKGTERYEVDRLEYMKMIQDIIKRMADNSSSIKSWCISITSGIFGINVWTNSNWKYFLFLLFPIIVFWFLDTYYLRQERLFRGLYDRVRKYNETDLSKSLYSMAPPQKHDADYKKTYNYINVFFSITERTLYGGLFIMALAIIILFACTGIGAETASSVVEATIQ